ncbi:MAG: hypothetical protein F6K23_27610 [Okeania sp. SIO2C9]|uniref:hypothetical protein n=1 Tax=Okeania sp. SIO2C9 TaxID=2607791 RepID=UPI0013BF46F7|nr:hypothetical protein [Okeania sp. SIO2C9]
MSVELQKRKFTVKEYYQMAEVGILKADDRVELIAGEIVEMAPIGILHAGDVRRLISNPVEYLLYSWHRWGDGEIGR